MKRKRRPKTEPAAAAFRRRGGWLRTSQALGMGIHPRTLYRLRDEGFVVAESRGVYRLTELPAPDQYDLVVAAKRVPKGTVCLISALYYHGITTQIPHEVQMALPRAARTPRIDRPRTRVFRFSEVALDAGVEVHSIQGVKVRVYCPEKTVADCFKFRNKIGLDVALEALRFCRKRKHSSVSTLLKYARICRVERVMMPYLEALA